MNRHKTIGMTAAPTLTAGFASAAAPDTAHYMSAMVKTRFSALQVGEIDMLWRSAIWTYDSDAALGRDFTGVACDDRQEFMVLTDLCVSCAIQIDAATVCASTGATRVQPANVNQTKPETNSPEPPPGLERGLNDIWTNNGQRCAVPIC